MNYDCEGCGSFMKIMVRTKNEFPTLTNGSEEICIDLPICTLGANCLAIKRCDFFTLSELRKEIMERRN